MKSRHEGESIDANGPSTSSLLQFNNEKERLCLFGNTRPKGRRTPSKRIPRSLWKPNLNVKLEELDVVASDSRVHKKSSKYRGVTKHRVTGRYEAHLWDKSAYNAKQKKKGRQVYLGAYDEETAAAQAYDLAALKYWGHTALLNFKLENYSQQVKEMEKISKEEYLATLRRKSSGFSRGVSKYRGVARHHHNGRWEARIGRVEGNKYLYLGTFGTQEEAAEAYDRAAILHRGTNAVTNFELSRYLNTPTKEGPGNKTTKNRLKNSHIVGGGGGLSPSRQMLNNQVSETTVDMNSPRGDHLNDEMKLTSPQDSSRFNSGDCEKMELGFLENDSFLFPKISGLNNLFLVNEGSLISSLPESISQPDEKTVFGSPEYDEIFADLSLDVMMAANE